MLNMEKRVTKILAEWCSVPVANLDAEQRIEQLGLDSMNLLEVQLAIQHEFDVNIEDEEFFKAETVGQLIGIVQASLPGA